MIHPTMQDCVSILNDMIESYPLKVRIDGPSFVYEGPRKEKLEEYVFSLGFGIITQPEVPYAPPPTKWEPVKLDVTQLPEYKFLKSLNPATDLLIVRQEFEGTISGCKHETLNTAFGRLGVLVFSEDGTSKSKDILLNIYKPEGAEIRIEKSSE